MRQHLAKLVPVIFTGGCSLIYNPSNIDKVSDANRRDMGEIPVDVEVRADAMPRDLAITEAFPTTIDEGSGTGGARPAVVVLRGRHFVKDAAAALMVTLSPAIAGAVTLESFEVAGNGDYIALAVTAPIAMGCNETGSVAVDVTVKQNDLMGGDVTQVLDDGFSVRCLDELDAVPASSNDLKQLYSRIEISGPLVFTPDVASTGRATLRSASAISIGGALTASGSSRDPGPGGGLGGVTGTGGNGTGPAPGLAGSGVGASGGGGGFLVAGTAGGPGLGTGGLPGGTTGDPWISKYSENSPSGGGGGIPGALGVPGVGGGAGGIVELTAPGNITVTGALAANGAAGTAGTSSSGSGGAGTGGVVLVRAGGMLMLPGGVSVAKGAVGGTGGASSDGRVRIDAAKGTYPTGPTECVVPFVAGCNMTKGPILVDPPTRTTSQMPTLTLRGTPNDQTATLRVFDKNGDVVAGMTYSPLFGTTGTAPVVPVLKAGYNKVCVWVAGGGLALPESVNCSEIAYLPL